MIHQGWKLVASPLYGNFKPAQQPYRTLILSREKKDRHIPADRYSLELIESAMNIFRECEIKRIQVTCLMKLTTTISLSTLH